MNNYTHAILKATEQIQKRGTLIVSFYCGKTFHKNVTLGSIRAGEDMRRYAYLHNRMLMEFADKTCLYGIDNNDDHQIKFWSLDEISEFSPLRGVEIRTPTFWERVATWIKYNIINPVCAILQARA